MADKPVNLNFVRGSIKGNITRLIKFFNENPHCDIDDVETRKLKLEECYQEFSKIQIQIELTVDEENLDEQEAYRDGFDKQYYACAKLISQRLRALKPADVVVTAPAPQPLASTAEAVANTNNITVQNTNNLLPKIEIQPFDGNLLEWCSFRDTFTSLVHEEDSIPTVQKFHLLKSLLIGELKSITAALRPSAENYTVAWNLLKERCERPRKIVQGHLQALLELPAIVKESPANIRNLKETAQMHINALEALGQPIASWDTFLVYIIIRKLDKTSRTAWERTLDNKEMPTFKSLTEFLSKQERGDDIELINEDHSNKNEQGNKRGNHSKSRAQAFIGTEKKYTCYFCQGGHSIYKCDDLLKLMPRDRATSIREKGLCLNCLRNHGREPCKSSGCRQCGRNHNTLLHFARDNTKQNNTRNNYTNNNNASSKHANEQSETHNFNEIPQRTHVIAADVTQTSELTANTLTITSDSEVLLGTARVKILDKFDNEHECRVLLDGCSQSHFITEKLADKLQLNKEIINLPFAGLGQCTTRAKYQVKTKIKSKINEFETELKFVALPSITGTLPSRSINKKTISIPCNIKLADPEFNKPAGIDVLIGTALFYKLLSTGQIKPANESNIILQKTLLGWIVTGEVSIASARIPKKQTCMLINNLENQLTKFWEIESIADKRHLSGDEIYCENLYAATTKRDDDGRYIVRLPFNKNIHQIGESYDMALQRFYSLERKLLKNPESKQEYDNFLREYRDLNHMTDITENDDKTEGFYVPHHAVIKHNNLTTKTRVVFDASAKSKTNISLNDSLRVGPVVQEDLLLISMRFRLPNVVLAGDLKKMYRQVKIDKNDAIFQKIIWREHVNEPVRIFRLDTATQGTASASFLATRTLLQLKNDEGLQFPLAARALETDFYVDDCLTGAKSVAEALELKQQLTELLKLGGFEVHKWASNKVQVLADDSPSVELKDMFTSSSTRKLLGIQWSPNKDIITYTVEPVEIEKRITKRKILSQIAQLFDPLGLLGPILISAKIIMQDLWKSKVTWDESIPLELYTRWTLFKKELHLINNFQVSRQIILPDATEVQLHGFSDASEHAYGACIYLRSINNKKECCIQLICAKSRVAPASINSKRETRPELQSLTIPRLELCAALLLVKLYKKVQDALKIKFKQAYLWSDSTIVLHWLRTSPHKLKTFVANRVAEIQALSNIQDWHHVSTSDNPADYISRGQTPSEFLINKNWLHGPSWLSLNETEWKIQSIEKINVPEIRTNIALVCAPEENIYQRFSSITVLDRFVALFRRAISMHRNKKLKDNQAINKISGRITCQELKAARLQIIKKVQSQYFSKEIKKLQEKTDLDTRSKILSLDPFLDSTGIIRVGGRISNSNFNFDKKYPILLPSNDHVTTLIIRFEHERNAHSGVQATLNTVREKYWPLDGKNTTRKIIHKCIKCYKFKPKISNYKMSDLPSERVTQTRPFFNVGIDYCGPFFIKEKKFRNKGKIKAWVVVFVCFTTRAVHLELVTDLTAETCLESIKRFVSRRGRPKNIFSDNGTNFIGAKNELKNVSTFLSGLKENSKIMSFIENEHINWRFNPPLSPHFGGLWEAAVKSFKFHFYRVAKDTLFSYEQFNTLIIQIESILNSRPLTPLSSDPNDLSALTPAHFLIGDSLLHVPEYDLQDIQVNRLSAWQHIQQVKQHFWQRWHKEYLNELRTRSKWHTNDPQELKIGTLVMIKDENLPPMYWSMGRIIELHPGPDKITRVVTVKTQSGVYQRCVKKLSPLPIDT